MNILRNKYFRTGLAIASYLLTMYVLGDYVIVPLFKKIFNLEFYNNLLILSHSHFSYLVNTYNSMISVLNVILQASIYLLAIVFLLVFLYPELNKDFDSYKNNEGKILSTIGVGVLLYFGLTIASGILTQALASINGSSPESQNQNAIVELFNNGALPKIAMVLTTVVVGPLVEELVFRKSIFNLIPNKIVALVVSSIIFGLIHTINFDYSFMDLIIVTIPYISAGISFGYVYYKTDNIYASYFLHAGLNLLSVLSILFMWGKINEKSMLSWIVWSIK